MTMVLVMPLPILPYMYTVHIYGSGQPYEGHVLWS